MSTYVDPTSKIDRKWLIEAANGPARCLDVGNGQFRLPPCRLSFANLVEPRESRPEPGQQPRRTFDAAFLLPPELGLADLKPLVDTVHELAQANFGPSWEQLVKLQKIYLPFKDQFSAVDKSGNRIAGYAEDGIFFNAVSQEDKPPTLTDVEGNSIPLDTAAALFASGNWVIPTVRPYAYKKQRSGVALGINAVVFLCKDNPLGGGAVSAKTAAAGLAGLAAPPPNLAALQGDASSPFD